MNTQKKNKNDNSKNKIIIILCILIIIVFLIVPFIVNIAFRHEAPVDILAARWEASDALAYIAASLAFLGTFFLGLITWKQNEDLRKLELNHFIADNSCEVFFEKIEFQNFNQNVCDVDNEHMESIVLQNDKEVNECESFQLVVTLRRESGYPTQVRVNDMLLFLTDDKRSTYLWTKRYDDTFNKIATAKEYNMFNVTVLLKPDLKKKIAQQLQDTKRVLIEMDVELLSASYVSTQLKLRGEFQQSSQNGLKNVFEAKADQQMSFFGNTSVYAPKEVQARMQNHT